MSDQQKRSSRLGNCPPEYDYTQDKKLDYKAGATSLDRLLKEARLPSTSSDELESDTANAPEDFFFSASPSSPPYAPPPPWNPIGDLQQSSREEILSTSQTAPNPNAETQNQLPTTSTQQTVSQPTQSLDTPKTPQPKTSPQFSFTLPSFGTAFGKTTKGKIVTQTMAQAFVVLPGEDTYEGFGPVEDFLHRFEAVSKVQQWDAAARAYYFPLYLLSY